MSPHLPSYQTFINFIMRGLQTDVSPLTDAPWWDTVCWFCFSVTLSCQLFLQTEEKRWSLCAKQRKHSSSQEVIIHSVISRGVFLFFFLHKRTSLWRKHIDYSLERFTLYTFSFTWTSLLMLQHQMFASVVAKLIKYLSKVVGLYQNTGASIMKPLSCGWIDFSALLWSECWHLIHRCVFKSCPVSCIDPPHCRHFDLSLQRQHGSN